MPASRWHSGLNDLFQWMGEEENELFSMMLPSMFSQFQKKDSEFRQIRFSRKGPIRRNTLMCFQSFRCVEWLFIHRLPSR